MILKTVRGVTGATRCDPGKRFKQAAALRGRGFLRAEEWDGGMRKWTGTGFSLETGGSPS